MSWAMRDMASLIDAQRAGGALDGTGPTVITAAGTGDNTEIVGATIDNTGMKYSSALVVIGYHATLAATKTLSIAADVEHANNSSFTSSTTVTLQTATVEATGEAGGSEETGVVKFVVDLSDKGEYVRLNYTPDLNASGTDVAQLEAIYLLMGARDTGDLTAADNTV